MTAEMLAEELHGRIQLLTARALDRGHDLTVWVGDGYARRAACRRCGARLSVTVTVSKTETIETAATLDCN